MTISEINKRKEELEHTAKNLETLRNWCFGVKHQDLVTQVEESSNISTTLPKLLDSAINCIARETNRLDAFIKEIDIGNV